jgi:hypothetical protein
LKISPKKLLTNRQKYDIINTEIKKGRFSMKKRFFAINSHVNRRLHDNLIALEQKGYNTSAVEINQLFGFSIITITYADR